MLATIGYYGFVFSMFLMLATVILGALIVAIKTRNKSRSYKT